MDKQYETNWEFDGATNTWRPLDLPGMDAPSGDSAWDSGDIKLTARTTAPNGWLLCDGSLVNRDQYGSLFRAIQFNYSPTPGADPGSNQFYVPNLKGRVVVMRDAGVTALNAVGKSGGSRDAALVSHSHTVNSHGHGFVTQGHHGHGFVAEAPWTGGHSANHSHAFTSGTVSSDHGHSVNSVVFMNCSATHGHGGGCGQLAESPSYGGCTGFGCNGGTGWMSHNHTHGGTTAGVNVDHSHQLANHGHGFVAQGDHNHGFVSEAPGTNTQGVAATDANMPPYLVMNYLIKI